MKYSKQASLSTDTRLSRSGIFNNSSLNNSSTPLQIQATISNPSIHPHSNKNFYMSNNIQNSQNKQVEFLRIKNSQLEERNRRLAAKLKELEENKKELLGINGKYVDVVNRYYEDRNRLEDHDNRSGGEVHRVLDQLERDHRNLVKHCLAMQQQIKSYQSQMQAFQTMKSHLQSVNHTSVLDLVSQIEQLSQQNRSLRKTNNSLSFQLQKCRQSLKNHKKIQQKSMQESSLNSGQLSKLKSLINTTMQQSQDKSNQYQSRIYQLELKVEKLQKQLRQGQNNLRKEQSMRREMGIREVEIVHENEKLQKNIGELLRNRERATFAYNVHSRMRNGSQGARRGGTGIAGSGNEMSISGGMNVFRGQGKNQRRSLAEKGNILG